MEVMFANQRGLGHESLVHYRGLMVHEIADLLQYTCLNHVDIATFPTLSWRSGPWIRFGG